MSASTDKRDTTVVDLVGDAYPRRELFPAGRLDKTSTGFVLLTDDGGFAHDILAPKRHVSKTYTVTLDTPLTEQMRTGFAGGGHAGRRHGPVPGRGDRPFAGRPDRAGGAEAGGVPPDQTDVWRVRRRGERPAPGRHRRACTGPRTLRRASGGSFRTMKWQKLPDDEGRFSPDFKKATHFYS